MILWNLIFRSWKVEISHCLLYLSTGLFAHISNLLSIAVFINLDKISNNERQKCLAKPINSKSNRFESTTSWHYNISLSRAKNMSQTFRIVRLNKRCVEIAREHGLCVCVCAIFMCKSKNGHYTKLSDVHVTENWERVSRDSVDGQRANAMPA